MDHDLGYDTADPVRLPRLLHDRSQQKTLGLGGDYPSCTGPDLIDVFDLQRGLCTCYPTYGVETVALNFSLEAYESVALAVPLIVVRLTGLSNRERHTFSASREKLDPT